VTTQELLEKSADKLSEYGTTLDNVLYHHYSKERLETELDELSQLENQLRDLANSDLIIAHEVMKE